MKKKQKASDNTLGWVLMGAGTALGLYWLFSKKAAPGATPGITTTMPVPPTAAPLGYATLGAVQSRFDDLRDIYHMGKVTPQEAISQVDALESAAVSLTDRGVGDAEGARQLVERLEDFKAQIQDFIDFKKSLEVQP